MPKIKVILISVIILTKKMASVYTDHNTNVRELQNKETVQVNPSLQRNKMFKHIRHIN